MLSGLNPISNYSSRVFEVYSSGSSGIEQVQKVHKTNGVAQKKQNEAKSRESYTSNGKSFSDILKSKIDRKG